MFPTFPSPALAAHPIFATDQIGWSHLYDYQSGSAPVYILWAPTAAGTGSNRGYIQRFTYVANAVTASEWAVLSTTAGINPNADWTARTTLTYQ